LLSERGEAEYLAPEARREEAKLRPSADVYSLAVMAGEMLSGARYGRDTERWNEVKGRLPARVLAALEQGWAESPDDRFGAAQSFFNALSAAVTDGKSALAPVPMALESESGNLEPQAFKASSLVDEVEPSDPVLLVQPTGRPPKQPVPSPAPMPVLPPEPPPVDLDTPIVVRRREAERRQGERRIPTERVRRPLNPGAGQFRRTAAIAAGIVLVGLLASAALVWRTRGPLRLPTLAPVVRTQDAVESQPRAPSKQPERPSIAPAPPAVPGPAPAPAEPREVAPSASHLLARLRHAVTLVPTRSGVREKGHKEPEPSEKPAAPSPEPPPLLAAPTHPTPPPPPPPPTPVAPPFATMGQPTPPSPVVSGMATPAIEPTRSAAPVEAPLSSGECPAGMTFVPGGTFEMGSSGEDPLAGFGELPAGAVRVAAFCIDTYEFPNEAGALPLVSVTWEMARSFCEKRGRRLCSEAEWERACKGPVNARFPFGNGANDSICNVSRPGRASARRPSGSFPGCRSDFGVFDLAGNVAEWTQTAWSGDVPDKVIKGGASDQNVSAGRCAARANEPAQSRQSNLGFRCCKEGR
jgi:eukaryotic-like serine/threonine-protein kinase